MNVLPNGVEHQEQDFEMRENVAYKFEPRIYGDKINVQVAYGPPSLSNIIMVVGVTRISC